MTAFSPTLTVERLSFATLTELPHSWHAGDYRALLTQLNFDNPNALPEAETEGDVSRWPLTDLEPREAAVAVLTYLFPEELTAGQVENLSHQMLTERLWEENPELPLHRGFYQATQLLHEAFNGTFPSVKAVEFSGEMHGGEPGLIWLFLDPIRAKEPRRLRRCCACWQWACPIMRCSTGCIRTIWRTINLRRLPLSCGSYGP